MKVCIFEPWYDEGHRKLLRALADGIPNSEVHDVRKYVECDVAVIFGMVKKSYANTKTKADIIRKHKGQILVMERGYVNREQYYSLGWNGINGRADFCNDDMPDDRWKALQVELMPWHDGGSYALVCGQVPWDVSVQDTDHVAWCQQVVDELTSLGHKVKFRPHPLAVARDVDYGIPVFQPRSLADDLADARFCVTWNSNSAVEAVLAGVPAVAMDIGSMAWEVAANSIDEPLYTGDRTQWAANIAYAQWTQDEFASGEAWKHISRSIVN